MTVMVSSFPEVLEANVEKHDVFFCNASDPLIQEYDIFRLHKNGDYEIVNDNVADLRGVVLYACVFPHFFPWLNISLMQFSHSKVDMDTRFGPYDTCHDGKCGDPVEGKIYVGREGAAHTDPSDQCSKSFQNGYWYVTIANFECNSTSVIGKDCAWRNLGVQKTIEGKCLLTHGLKDACDHVQPYVNADKIFEKAFNSEDVSEGGCPNVHQLVGSRV